MFRKLITYLYLRLHKVSTAGVVESDYDFGNSVTSLPRKKRLLNTVPICSIDLYSANGGYVAEIATQRRKSKVKKMSGYAGDYDEDPNESQLYLIQDANSIGETIQTSIAHFNLQQ